MMVNRTHRVSQIAYWMIACLIIFGGDFWIRQIQQEQTLVAVKKAFAIKDYVLVMNLEQADFANELWVSAVMWTLFVAIVINAPLLRDLQDNGWKLAIKSRKLWGYVQLVTFISLAFASFHQPVISLRWLAMGLIGGIVVVTWLHWRNVQKYREYFSDPANYLIER